MTEFFFESNLNHFALFCRFACFVWKLAGYLNYVLCNGFGWPSPNYNGISRCGYLEVVLMLIPIAILIRRVYATLVCQFEVVDMICGSRTSGLSSGY